MIIWFISKSIAYQLWAIPVIYCFWPKLRERGNANEINNMTFVTSEDVFIPKGKRDVDPFGKVNR